MVCMLVRARAPRARVLQSTGTGTTSGAKTIPREVDHEVDLVRVDDGRDLVRREALRQVLEHVARLNPPSPVQRSAAQRGIGALRMHTRPRHAMLRRACLIVARVFEPSSPVSA
jgi:hypothetical protein